MLDLNEIAWNIKGFFVKNNFYQKIVISVGVSAVGFTLFFKYYLLNKKKKIHDSQSASIIDSIQELKQSNIRIKDAKELEKTLLSIIRSGKHRLQVICDFDRTISKYEHQGIKSETSCSVLENSPFVSEEIRNKFESLRNTYLPIEYDPKMSKDEKIPFMKEWWTKSQELTVMSNIYADNICEIVKKSKTQLRDGCNWFFYTLERCDIPVMIFSAGLGNIVEEFIKQRCGLYKNMKIVSNFMKFNISTNKLIGFQGKLIHVFNKNERVLLDTDYEKLIENRRNVILIGDSVGDANMAEGLPEVNVQLKIGFLNDNVEELLPIYEKQFDILIIKDETFNVPNAILRSII